MNLLRYIAGRLVVYVLVIVFALTVLFFVPRLGPTDPVEAMLAKVASRGAYMDAAQVDMLRQSLADTFGLDGSLLDQYWAFIKRIVFTADFGPSLSMYPTPVMELIWNALPLDFRAAAGLYADRFGCWGISSACSPAGARPAPVRG
ncbi:hypothetical protein N8D56_26800 (plasmid) [Devosia sp. A8/3-2]|nr:hypothetical protein N8D56_26800 [Devosia sp. A8/3-2]